MEAETIVADETIVKPETIEADASPQKGFFINMITKDISLLECILDLLDNSVDGANNHIIKTNKEVQKGNCYEGYSADIEFSEAGFKITDNCGGIPFSRAEHYVFNFGRSHNAPALPGQSIGFYGIGMKRAMFKIGKKINIDSSTEENGFTVDIDVNNWETQEDGKWHFDLVKHVPATTPVTKISITKPTPEAVVELGDPEFVSNLIEEIKRDYSLILKKGFKIKVNEVDVVPLEFYVLEGGEFAPVYIERDLKAPTGGIVKFQIHAGLWRAPEPDETDSQDDVDPGWYVICNDRIILAGDKTYRTGWNEDTVPKWHSQYKPFIGFAVFLSTDPSLLPWNTTKRGIDLNSEVYRQALVFMGEVTKQGTDYTNKRKLDPETAKKFESQATMVPVFAAKAENMAIKYPSVTKAEPPVKMATISYRVPNSELQKVKATMGNILMSNKDVGEETFNYYVEKEVE